MMRGWVVGLAVIAIGAAACGPANYGSRVRIVPTRTPGLAYVIVRPYGAPDTKVDGKTVLGSAEYFLLCDGRGKEGLKCEVPAEAATDRASFHPAPAVAPTAVEEDVGSVAPLNVHTVTPSAGTPSSGAPK